MKFLGWALVFSLLAMGCGKKSEDTLSGNSIVGDWLLVKITWKGQTTESDVSYTTSNAYRFAADGSYQYNNYANYGQTTPTEVGTYSVKDNVLTLTSKAGAIVTAPILEETSDGVLLQDTNKYGSVTNRRYRKMNGQESALAFK